LRKITLGRKFLSDALFANGTSRLVMNTNRCGRLASMRLRNFRPGSPVGTVMMIRLSRRSRSYRHRRRVVSFSVSRRCPERRAERNKMQLHYDAPAGSLLRQHPADDAPNISRYGKGTETDEAIRPAIWENRICQQESRRSRRAGSVVRGIPRAQVTLAWLLAKPVITAPIVGATKLKHLDDALASVDVKPSPGEITTLEEPDVLHAVVGIV
jgi:Aldo/keto reductase family